MKKRDRMLLGAAVTLAAALALDAFGGVYSETDFDGVPDPSDNCLIVPNGPALATGSCNTQLDADQDGYGNPCDTDVNNDGATGLDDVLFCLGGSKVASTDPLCDFNCDGAVGLDDALKALNDSKVGQTPGPSGLACAGTIPCP